MFAIASEAGDASLLDDAERRRADDYQFAKDRASFIACRTRLRQLLSAYLERSAADIAIGVGPHGRPHLVDHGLNFNVARSGGYGLAAISQSDALGVDLEECIASDDLRQTAQTHFSRAEWAALEPLSGTTFVDAFFACWTRKEAVLKADGRGFSLPLSSFDVSIGAEPVVILRADGPAENISDWRLIDVAPRPGYSAAVAVSYSAPKLQVFHVHEGVEQLILNRGRC